MSTGQSSSPGWQLEASGHAAPRPLFAAVCSHTRSSAASHAVVHGTNEPTQSTFPGHSASPGRHDGASGHVAPFPLCATASVQVRSSARSQSSVHGDHAPAQSVCTVATQPPSPARHDNAGGHGSPCPLWLTISVHVRELAASHACVQGEKDPSHPTSSGQPPSPAWHEEPSGHAAPRPLWAAV